MSEHSRGFDYVVIGFSKDGRAMLAVTCATIKEADRWAEKNPSYKWVVYNANGYQLLPMPVQISFL